VLGQNKDGSLNIRPSGWTQGKVRIRRDQLVIGGVPKLKTQPQTSSHERTDHIVAFLFSSIALILMVVGVLLWRVFILITGTGI
jgi:hypothetical protein